MAKELPFLPIDFWFLRGPTFTRGMPFMLFTKTGVIYGQGNWSTTEELVDNKLFSTTIDINTREVIESKIDFV